MFDKIWIKDTLERAVKTFLQTFLSLLLLSIPADSDTLQWANFVTASNSALAGAVAAAISVLSSALS